MRKTLTALLLCSAILLQGCAFNFASAARTVGRSAGLAIPVVQSLVDSGECRRCANIITVLQRIEDDSSILAQAFEQHDNTTALEKAAAITRSLEQLIAVDSKLIPQGKRTLVLALLAAADIAISEIANHTQKEADAPTKVVLSRSADAQVMIKYAAKPRLQCRSSITGRFEKMDYCKANPNNSTVERH